MQRCLLFWGLRKEGVVVKQYGWLSIFLLPKSANAAKIMVPPHDEKENEGLE